MTDSILQITKTPQAPTYDVGEKFVLPDLTGLPGVAGVAEPRVEDLEEVFFDTDDLRLLVHGGTLSHRACGPEAGWYLEVRSGNRVVDDVRLPSAGVTRRIPDELLRRVQVYARGGAIQEIARLRTHRIVYRLHGADGGTLTELSHDQVTASLSSPDGGSTAHLWSDVTLHPVIGDRRLRDALAIQLVSAGATSGGWPSRPARALAGRLVEVIPDGPAVLPERSAAAVVLAHLIEQVQRLQASDPRVRADEPDAVHQMRVAARRLRSTLRTFRPLFERQVVDPLREELRWLGGVLSGARDAEVIRKQLRAAACAEPAELVLGPVQARIVTAMGTRYRSAHDAVVAELDGRRYFDLLDALDRLVVSPPLTLAAYAKRDKVLLPLVSKTYTRSRRLHRRMSAERDAARRETLLHDVRKAAKRARYAGETLVPVHGKAAERWAGRMEAVQERLGALQDSVVARRQLRELGVAAHLDGENGFSYGLLYGGQRSRGVAAVADYRAAWKRTRKAKLHRWLKA